MTNLPMINLLLRLMLVAAASAAPAFAWPAEHNHCPASSADDYYFPTGALNSKARTDEFERQWFSSQLAAMGEPSLSCGSRKDTTYRFIWLRSFDHPVAVRIVESREQFLLTAVELSGAGGYKPGHVLQRIERVFAKSQIGQLQQALDSPAFWDRPTEDDRRGLDGSEWIIEGSKNGNYHVVVRWTPSDGPVHDLGMRFLELTGWRFERMY